MSEQWSNPPVFYALAQIQFNAIPEHKFADDIQQAFREAGFPDAVRDENLILNVTTGKNSEEAPTVNRQATTRHNYLDTHRREGFVRLSNMLTYHTTNYQTFEHFKARFRLGLETLAKVTTPDYVTRVGARYLDLVRPEAKESLTQYLVPEVLGLSDRVQAGGHSLSETVVATLPMSLISRVFINNQTQPQPRPPMPNELFPLHLSMEEGFQQVAGKVAVVDTDSFEMLDREPFNVDKICGSLDRVKQQIQSTFDSIITTMAQERWR